MKKILISVLSIAVVGAVAFGATKAFFSDTETSTGNVLAAGAIDLKIDNTSYAIDYNIPGFNSPTGALVASTNTTWTLNDLTVEKFFNFTDLKPGDYGEDTISVHVNSNNAWLCAAARVTANSDETCTEPENTDENNGCVVETNGTNGDLAQQVNFAFWKDDGDNVLEVGETPFLSGPISGLNGAGQIALADTSTSSVFGQSVPIPGNTDVFIGKAWCFGNLVATPLTQDGVGTDGPIAPNRVGTGFTCDGSAVNNAAQTDKVVGDLQFYAVQSRNNAEFTCAQNYTPVWPNVEEQRPTVGALLSAYVKPACNVTVSNGGAEPSTITEGIAAASNGNTVCVDAGTYNEDVVINKEITLAGDGATNTSTINGQATGQGAAVTIAANNVTLEGFNINGAGIAALWLNTGVSSANVHHNHLTSASGGVTALTTQGQQSNSVFNNNTFTGNGSGQLAYVNGAASLGVGQASSNVDFTNNTFNGTIVSGGVALGNESTGSDITENKFAATLTSTYAIAETWEDDANINFNNFNGVGGIKVRNGDTGTVDAENNWWGAAIPAGHTAGNVDDDPKEASAFPEN